jgi:hypothetical protein
MISRIQSLADYIASNYLIPPKYIEKIKEIIPNLVPLKTLPFEKVGALESDETI